MPPSFQLSCPFSLLPNPVWITQHLPYNSLNGTLSGRRKIPWFSQAWSKGWSQGKKMPLFYKQGMVKGALKTKAQTRLVCTTMGEVGCRTGKQQRHIHVNFTNLLTWASWYSSVSQKHPISETLLKALWISISFSKCFPFYLLYMLHFYRPLKIFCWIDKYNFKNTLQVWSMNLSLCLALIITDHWTSPTWLSLANHCYLQFQCP